MEEKKQTSKKKTVIKKKDTIKKAPTKKEKIIEKAYEEELETEELKLDGKFTAFLNAKNSFKNYELILFFILIVAVSVFLTVVVLKESSSIKKSSISKSITEELSEVEEVYNILNNEYYVTPDKSKLVEGAIKGMLESLGDPHTAYFNKSETEQFNDIMLGSYEGIGAEISIDSEKNIIVFSVFKNSPAQEGGLKNGDIIVEVNGTSAKGKTTPEVVNLIKDPEKPVADIKINRAGKEMEFKITKRLIIIPTVESKTYQKNGKKVGYIAINSFADNTYNQFKNAIEDLEKQNIKSLVIDVRNDTGGYLHSVTSILNIILPKDKVMYQISDNKGTTKYKSTSSESRNYPIVVLTNNGSASASEILALALNESYGAKIVGTTTYGKGTVQATKDLTNGAMIKYTIQKWLSPKGNWINDKGVEPTIKVELTDDYSKNPTDDNDNQLQKALDIASK